MRYRIANWNFAALTVIALAGCGSAATPAAPASVAVSSAAPVAPTEAPPSQAAASDFPSFAIPSFAWPSTDKELEAVLPATICGGASAKFSFSGAMFAQTADPTFVAVLNQLGKTAADVSMAGATGAGTECTAAIFRIKGADANQFRDIFLAEMAKEITFTEQSIGGKTVFVGSDPDVFHYGYFKGDALIFFTAPDEAKAAELAASLP
jgi:hypothetical protein